jgi:hypothetical protein
MQLIIGIGYAPAFKRSEGCGEFVLNRAVTRNEVYVVEASPCSPFGSDTSVRDRTVCDAIAAAATVEIIPVAPVCWWRLPVPPVGTDCPRPRPEERRNLEFTMARHELSASTDSHPAGAKSSEK